MNILVVFALFAVPTLGSKLNPVPGRPHESRIINGEDVDIRDFPHQGSLKRFGRHVCGCALIGGKYALTAAHCIKGGAYFYEVKFGSANKLYGGVRYDVVKIIKHPEWSDDGSRGYPYDVAILVLEREVEENEFIQRIRMATPEDGDFANEECNITGWGNTETGWGSITLQGAAINVLSSQECRDYWNKTRSDYHVCVGGQGEARGCYGDSGGPLTCIESGANVLVGLTSWGIFGCYTSYPTVYTRVSTYHSWVLENIETDYNLTTISPFSSDF